MSVIEKQTTTGNGLSKVTVPTGYKHTEVGVIPEEWKVVKVGEHAHVTTGSRNTQDKVDDGLYPFFVRSQEVERINSYSYEGEAVLTAGDGVGTGKIYHYINGRFDVHQRVYRISDFSSELNGKYFYYQFSNRFYNRIMSMTAKSSVDSVRKEMITGMPIPLPPLPEQRAIAEALSDVDKLIESLDKLIAKKKAIKQAAMQQLLTGKVRLPGFQKKKGYKKTEVGVIPEDWEVVKLGKIAKIFDGTHQTPNYVEDGIPFYSVENVTSGDFKNTKFISPEEHKLLSSTVRIEKGDVLMTRIGSIGECVYVDWEVNASFYVSLALLKIFNAHAPYIAAYSHLQAFKKEIELHSLPSAIPKKINLGAISNVRIALPSKLEEQFAIADVLSDMDTEIQALERRREKIRKIKQGMMQQLLTGKVRIVDF